MSSQVRASVLTLNPPVIVEWVSTLLDNVRKLTGRRAPPHEHQRIAYLLTRFSPLVTAIQHLSLYHAGEGLVCEVDIVLPPDTSLPVAHNLGEAAQYAIEQLSGIERAFVCVRSFRKGRPDLACYLC